MYVCMLSLIFLSGFDRESGSGSGGALPYLLTSTARGLSSAPAGQAVINQKHFKRTPLREGREGGIRSWRRRSLSFIPAGSVLNTPGGQSLKVICLTPSVSFLPFFLVLLARSFDISVCVFPFFLFFFGLCSCLLIFLLVGRGRCLLTLANWASGIYYMAQLCRPIGRCPLVPVSLLVGVLLRRSVPVMLCQHALCSC